jgi:integrase
MHRFSLHKRGTRFYVQFWNPETASYTSAKSTGATTRRDARLIAESWIQTGIPDRGAKLRYEDVLRKNTLLSLARDADIDEQSASQLVEILTQRGLIHVVPTSPDLGVPRFADFLTDFWDYEKSAYVAEKLAYGHRIGRRHCYDMARAVANYWVPFFGAGPKLDAITRDDLRRFATHIASLELAPKTRNNILAAGTTALGWAHVNELIPNNPAKGIRKFSGKAATKGILTDDEVRRIFALEWKDERARLGNLLAATTGLRAGEIVALRLEDIGDETLSVRHSWSEHDGLKSTKTNEERVVPVLSEVRDALRAIARKNPHGWSETSFVFWSSVREDRPVTPDFLSDGLRTILVRLTLPQSDIVAAERSKQRRSHKMVVDPSDLEAEQRFEKVRAEWQKRNVTFHSWRHYYSTRMADHLDQRAVMLSTGHKTAEMFEHYANHRNSETLKLVRDTSEQVFGFLAG